MQATPSTAALRPTSAARKFSWFMVFPLTAVVVALILSALLVITYQQYHRNRVFTGVMVAGIGLDGMNGEEALEALSQQYPNPAQKSITLTYPKDGQSWQFKWEELGLSLDDQATIKAAMMVGREGGPISRMLQQFDSWYYGRQVAPILVFDERVLDEKISEVAAEIDRPALDAALGFDGIEATFSPSQAGRQLDRAYARERVIASLERLDEGEIQLLVQETQPRVHDTSEVAQVINNIIGGPIEFYLQEPLDEGDFDRVTLSEDELVKWMRIQTVNDETDQARTEIIIDENALRAWLAPLGDQLKREPENARFYFDDNTQELVLVEPHVNGRELDIEATVERFLEQVKSPNRSVPFVMRDIVPTVNAQATTTDLGITELVSESTTWFFGSSNERMHNIARSAANFYGIVIAPGEEFSFNQFLGEVSADQGYETGLIIFGGRTIEGIGGGVCQVSTTVFQAAFWAGFPVVERWQHGYQVGYYDDGEGPGMDATVYSPLVDFRFINDTPYHLLIENYYSEANSSLTFKFYSTSLGRTVVKEGPVISNVVPAKPDIWELDEELESGTIEQVDWAVEGADVSVGRQVFNARGELIRQDLFESRYVPWQNIYKYGPGTELPGSDDDGESAPET
ncbi:MAG: VanW family protein [Anaerolineae bacterium]|nr:MAG: VanW family protein [Anaerolineae bacterium]